jgi:hypothetical protein
MTGQSVSAASLLRQDRIHLEPHPVPGHTGLVGHGELDVEVVAVVPVDGSERVVIEWRESAQFLGGDPRITGASVYQRAQQVLRIGRAA